VAEQDYRAGHWGSGNLAIGGVFAPVLAALAVLAWVSALGPQTAPGASAGWDVVAGTLALLAAVVCAWTAVEGASTWRPVRFAPDAVGRPALSVPVFATWRGPRRVEVPVDDVAEVALEFRSAPRSSRWQLAVTRTDGSSVTSDSITSSRRRDADVSGTPAGRAVEEIGRRVRALQTGSVRPS
jgi:hypothetical protein